MQDETQKEEKKRDYFPVVFRVLVSIITAMIGGYIALDARYQNRLAEKEQIIKQQYERAENEKQKRIEMYERLIFYKGLVEHRDSIIDSTVREKTEVYVNEILK